jgi:polyketide synthase 13
VIHDNEQFLQWLIGRVAHHTSQNPQSISPDARIETTGLDSMNLVVLSADIEERIGKRVNPEWMFEHATLRALAQFLSRL